MKSKNLIFLPFLIIILSISLISLTSLASATVGIGIKWTVSNTYIAEDTESCLTYGLYNPFNRDVSGYLHATKDLEPLYSAEEPKLIEAGTPSESSVSTKICFDIPTVYPKSCIFGLMCERNCEGVEEVIYQGEVIGAYELGEAGSGSATGSSFAAPLKLKVLCETKERNYLPLILLIIILIAIWIWLILKKRKGKVKRPRRRNK